MLFQDSFPVASTIPTLSACIDIALMYDPFVLYSATLLDKPEPHQVPDRYPGETFIEACEAVKRIGAFDPDSTTYSKYYEALCTEMKLPSRSGWQTPPIELPRDYFPQRPIQTAP
jgi:hypothetical protein